MTDRGSPPGDLFPRPRTRRIPRAGHSHLHNRRGPLKAVTCRFPLHPTPDRASPAGSQGSFTPGRATAARPLGRRFAPAAARTPLPEQTHHHHRRVTHTGTPTHGTEEWGRLTAVPPTGVLLTPGCRWPGPKAQQRRPRRRRPSQRQRSFSSANRRGNTETYVTSFPERNAGEARRRGMAGAGQALGIPLSSDYQGLFKTTEAATGTWRRGTCLCNVPRNPMA